MSIVVDVDLFLGASRTVWVRLPVCRTRCFGSRMFREGEGDMRGAASRLATVSWLMKPPVCPGQTGCPRGGQCWSCFRRVLYLCSLQDVLVRVDA